MIPKFRARRKDNGQWVTGVPIPNSFGEAMLMIVITLDAKISYPVERLHEFLFEVHPDTLSEQTLFTYPDETVVYEKDIVNFHSFFTGFSLDGAYEDEFIAEKVLIKKEYGEFGFWFKEVWYSLADLDRAEEIHEESFEKLGNIYENPELARE